MADSKQGIEYEITAKDATGPGVESATKKVEESAKKAEASAKKMEDAAGKAGGAAKKAGSAIEEAAGRITKSVGRLPGVFGMLQTAIGGFAGTAAACIGAFKMGWDIGTWINNKVVRPLLGIKDPIEELKRKNRELRKAAEEAAEKWAEAQDRLADRLERNAEAADQAVARIDRLAAAYIRLQEAKKSVADAETDAEILSLQRNKFEDMLVLGREGSPEQATQIGKYYDVMIAERRKERMVADADAAVEKAQSELDRSKQTIAKLKARERLAEEDYHKAEKRVDDIRKGNVDFDIRDDRRYKEALKRAESDQERALRSWSRIEGRRLDEERGMEAQNTELAARLMERANAEERANQEIDEKRKAYDDYIDYVRELDVKEAQDLAQEAEELDRKLRDEEYRDRRQKEYGLQRIRIDNARKEVQARAAMERDEAQRLAAARQAVDRAWGWYRDKDSLAQQIEEEKADAAARAQYEKDFDRLQRQRPDWEKAKNLSLDQEAVRRVALARREEADASRAVAETAENTRRAADALETIEMAFQEGGE